MFESFKYWLESLISKDPLQSENSISLFNDPDDEVINVALAFLLYQLIEDNKNDKGNIYKNARENKNEANRNQFSRVLQAEFKLTSEQVAAIYPYVKTLKTEIRNYLDRVNLYLKDKPALRLNLMTKLVRLMKLSGVKSKELEIFNYAIHVFLPKLKSL